ncbi:MAG: signal transduction histidine kinase [Bacteriovoracaceae bacterium]|jgi:signal transduction histidine kinase
MNIFNRVLNYLLAFALGLSIPVFFAYLDMWELEIDTNLSNLFDMLKSQNIYQFSALFFPIIFIFVTELVQQVKAKNILLIEEFEYLKVLLNATPDAIIFLNEDQEIIFQNNQFKLLFNRFDIVIENTNLSDFFNQVEYIQKEVVLDSNISKDHSFLMSFKLAKFKNRKNYFISFKDLKNLKDKEKIIEEQTHQMIEKNKLASLGEMAAGIAHEVNNPLTVIHSNNTIIQKLISRDKFDVAKIDKLTSKTREQIERITAIITSLRNLSRGLANEENESFSIDQVLDESIRLAKIRDKSKKIIFQFNNKPFTTYGNRGQIVQVILNLLNNAIDAIETLEDPWITLELKDNDKYVDLYITDSGEGIPKEVADKIFIPMYTTKDVGKGTGLGLSLSRTFIEQNKGSLNYITEQNNTCFKISLVKGDPIEENNDKENKEAA